MFARRFLGCIFILTLLAVAAGFAIYQWGGRALLSQSVPEGHFEAKQAGGGPDYTQASSWISRPGMPNDPSTTRGPTSRSAAGRRSRHGQAGD